MKLRLPLSALLVAALACTGVQPPVDPPPPPEPIDHDVPPPPPPPPPPEPPVLADTGAAVLPTPEDPALPQAEADPEPEPAPEAKDREVRLRITHRVPASEKATLNQKAARRLKMRAKAMGYDGVTDVQISSRRCTGRYCTVTASGLAVSND